MSLKNALKNLIVAYGGTPVSGSVKGLLKEFVILKEGSGEGRTVAEHIEELAAIKEPLFKLKVDTSIETETDLLGKTISDLQENITIHNGVVYGVSKYVSDYTGFSGDPKEQSGNYIAFHAEVPDEEDVTITFTGNKTVTLDSDGILILLIGSKDRTVSFTATKSGHPSVTKKFNLKGLTLNKQ